MSKNVSSDTLKELYKVQKDNLVKVEIGKIEDKAIMMEVKRCLSASEFVSFVNDMSTSEWNINEENSEEFYKPGLGHMAFTLYLVQYYSNVNIPSDIELAYEMIINLELDSKIIAAIDSRQYTKLCRAIRLAQEYVKSQKVGLNGIITMIKKIVESFDPSKATNEFNRILEKLTPEQIGVLNKALATGDFYNSVQSDVDNKFLNLAQSTISSLKD